MSGESKCRWSKARQRWEREFAPGVSKEPCGHPAVSPEHAPTPVPSEVAETTAGEREVEALGTWLEHYLGNYTFPANYVAPLYGQTHREVAKYVGPVIAEDLLDSPALAALLDRVRREEGAKVLREFGNTIATPKANEDGPTLYAVWCAANDWADQIEDA